MYDKCTEVLHISYTMCTCDLPDIYTLSPCACHPWAWALGVYIRQITRAHGIAIKYTALIIVDNIRRFVLA